MFQRPLLFLTGFLVALGAQEASAEVTLFAVDRNGPILREISSIDAFVFDDSRILNFGGTPISGAQGLARHPQTGVLFAIVTDASNVQSLVTIDEVSGECTVFFGLDSSFYSDIAFSSEGTLYGVTGTVGSNSYGEQGAIHIFQEGTGSFGSFAALTNAPLGGHSIAWDPGLGKLLHLTGGDNRASGVWEYRDFWTAIAEPPLPVSTSGPAYNLVSALLYRDAGTFYMADAASNLFFVEAATTNTANLTPMGFLCEGLASGPNDDCENAIPVSLGTIEGSLDGATNDEDADCGSSSASPDVWYRFLAQNDGTLNVSTCGTNDLGGQDLGIDTVLSVYSGCPGDLTTLLGCNDDALGTECTGTDSGLGRDSALSQPMTAGDEVWIRVSNFNNGATGPFVLNLDFARTNTLCADAVLVPGTGSVTGSLLGATQDGTSTCDGGGAGSVDTWYRYIPAADGTLNINTCGTFDLPGPAQGMATLLSVFDACGGAELACNDDSLLCTGATAGNRDSAVMLDLLAGQEIRIRVSNFSSAFFTSDPGPFVLNTLFTRANDTCADAAPIAEGNFMFNLAGSTQTSGLSCLGSAGEGDVWYEYTATEDGFLEVDTCGSEAATGTDTEMGLYDSCADLGSSGEIECNDDGINGPCDGTFDSYVSREVTAGQTTLIVVTRRSGGPFDNSDFFLNVNFTPKFENFCNGDGGSIPGCTNCPCGNNAPSGTIGGCFNSVGESARLEGSGDPSVGTDTMRFEMRGGNPNTFAILSSGPARAPANAVNPCFGTGSGVQSPVFNGLRCVVSGGMGPVQRHGTRPTDNLGNVGVSNNGWGFGSGPPGGLINQGGFSAGQTRHYQVIYREIPFGACLTTQNTSQGVTVTFTN